ncbi:MAG: hypothetical protein FWG51_03420, partial [Firmicutes bacterium]|nr:hypothetical protein [Bacillota bacterium]
MKKYLKLGLLAVMFCCLLLGTLSFVTLSPKDEPATRSLEEFDTFSNAVMAIITNESDFFDAKNADESSKT